MTTSIRSIAGRTAAAALMSIAALAACNDDSTSPPSTRDIFSATQQLGQGTVRSFVSVDASGAPTAVGVTISESAMASLPTTPMPGMPAAAMLVLPLPAEAARSGFDHVMLDWNPAGHEPNHVYTLPHFDFHFYQITSAERETIVPSNPAWATKAAAFPGATFVPSGYVAGSDLANVPPAAAAVPFMGMHWLDRSAPELQAPPAGKAFTTTLIYGSWDGRFIFIEPMITKAFIESTKGTAGLTFPVAAAERVQKAGRYPKAYSIRHNAAAREYRITLDSLTARQ
ncbi:MAG: DUF5602 domain-containing protein [Gemmatimonadaceae bacterium]|jgi:hypothetical protein|nr:DUF5602 domain-containing protein [Gemmatimonadaceae bacterium]